MPTRRVAKSQGSGSIPLPRSLSPGSWSLGWLLVQHSCKTSWSNLTLPVDLPAGTSCGPLAYPDVRGQLALVIEEEEPSACAAESVPFRCRLLWHFLPLPLQTRDPVYRPTSAARDLSSKCQGSTGF